MKNSTMLLAFAGVLAVVSVLPACTQMPTEKRGVVDLRPQIAFKVDDERLRSARVVLDGSDVGAVGDYLEGAAAVRILSGTHTLRVTNGAEMLLDERIYLGDGTNRTFIIK